MTLKFDINFTVSKITRKRTQPDNERVWEKRHDTNGQRLLGQIPVDLQMCQKTVFVLLPYPKKDLVDFSNE